MISKGERGLLDCYQPARSPLGVFNEILCDTFEIETWERKWMLRKLLCFSDQHFLSSLCQITFSPCLFRLCMTKPKSPVFDLTRLLGYRLQRSTGTM